MVKHSSALPKLFRSFKHQEVQQYLTGNNIQWTFNMERAPKWGGVFERMIESTKRCLRKIVGQAKLRYDELITVLTDIELQTIDILIS
jgi:hypothetical protein